MISCAAACRRNASGAAPRSMWSTSLRCKILGRDGRATSALSPIATIKADVLHFAFVPRHKVASLQPAARGQESR